MIGIFPHFSSPFGVPQSEGGVSFESPFEKFSTLLAVTASAKRSEIFWTVVITKPVMDVVYVIDSK
jgi:hypothetical protein